MKNQQRELINPFSGLKSVHMYPQRVYFLVLYLISRQCVLMKILSRANVKKKTKRPKDFQISHFHQLFSSGSERVNT